MIKKDLLLKIFNTIEYGELTLITPEDETIIFKGNQKGEKATLHLKKWDVVDALAFHQELGFSETFVEDKWDTPDLLNLTKFIIRNEKSFQKVEIGFFEGLMFWSQSSSVNFEPKKTLAELPAGYDFYTLLTNGTESATCGIFDTKNKTLKSAQKNLCAKVVSKLKSKGKNILVYGGDWGMLTKEFLQKKLEVFVYSNDQKQQEYLEDKFSKKAKFTLVKNSDDLRDLKFDNILILDLNFYFRAQEKQSFFARIKHMLSENGKLIMHTFTSDHNVAKENKFTRKYFKPDMWIPSLEELVHAIESAGLHECEIKDLEKSAVQTFENWYKNLTKNAAKIEKLGFDDKAMRMLGTQIGFLLSALETKTVSLQQVIIEN